MKTHLSRNFFGVLVISLVLLFWVSQTNAQYAVGDTVSNFTLSDVTGQNISLYDYQGQVILLNFFATW